MKQIRLIWWDAGFSLGRELGRGKSDGSQGRDFVMAGSFRGKGKKVTERSLPCFLVSRQGVADSRARHQYQTMACPLVLKEETTKKDIPILLLTRASDWVENPECREGLEYLQSTVFPATKHIKATDAS